jgi:hypothetical protein
MIKRSLSSASEASDAARAVEPRRSLRKKSKTPRYRDSDPPVTVEVEPAEDAHDAQSDAPRAAETQTSSRRKSKAPRYHDPDPSVQVKEEPAEDDHGTQSEFRVGVDVAMPSPSMSREDHAVPDGATSPPPPAPGNLPSSPDLTAPFVEQTRPRNPLRKNVFGKSAPTPPTPPYAIRRIPQDQWTKVLGLSNLAKLRELLSHDSALVHFRDCDGDILCYILLHFLEMLKKRSAF